LEKEGREERENETPHGGKERERESNQIKRKEKAKEEGERETLRV